MRQADNYWVGKLYTDRWFEKHWRLTDDLAENDYAKPDCLDNGCGRERCCADTDNLFSFAMIYLLRQKFCVDGRLLYSQKSKKITTFFFGVSLLCACRRFACKRPHVNKLIYKKCYKLINSLNISL